MSYYDMVEVDLFNLDMNISPRIARLSVGDWATKTVHRFEVIDPSELDTKVVI